MAGEKMTMALTVSWGSQSSSQPISNVRQQKEPDKHPKLSKPQLPHLFDKANNMLHSDNRRAVNELLHDTKYILAIIVSMLYSPCH